LRAKRDNIGNDGGSGNYSSPLRSTIPTEGVNSLFPLTIDADGRLRLATVNPKKAIKAENKGEHTALQKIKQRIAIISDLFL